MENFVARYNHESFKTANGFLVKEGFITIHQWVDGPVLAVYTGRPNHMWFVEQKEFELLHTSDMCDEALGMFRLAEEADEEANKLWSLREAIEYGKDKKPFLSNTSVLYYGSYIEPTAMAGVYFNKSDNRYEFISVEEYNRYFKMDLSCSF